MPSVTDILALLDKIPIWKDLKRMPARINELEKRLAALESKHEPSLKTCPKCGTGTFALVSTERDPIFGEMGVQNRLYRCTECGFSESLQYSSGKPL